ncbi:P-loop containing nucleoside triphosphate hydrolase protein [Absidia repens]|uniref:Kinesin-like protein n=1 Tax=Absidia repens TaxID=90262 RepID=A0A1X2I7V3_9FUNG|nr:P-loop containing nucleoside triphosphate hydrolase protein [Absidia repens]
MNRQKEKHRQQNQQLEHSNRQYEQRRAGFDAELKSIQSQTTRLFSKEEDIRQACVQLQEKEAKLMGAQKTVEDLTLQLEKTEARMFEIDTQLLEDEKIRRKRHNQFQELKGNIRVFCRMRPSLPSERTHEGALVQVQFEGGQVTGSGSDKMEFSEQVIASTVTNKRVTKTYPFSFDKIFTPEHGQAECFEEISQLVQSALDGYNVCIFAYGQTGSGKTFTMQGPATHNNNSNNKDHHDANNAGMIPRAVHQIYQVAQMLSDRGWTYTMEGQFLEIYNEAIHDLLGEVSDYGKIKHEIRHEKNGRTTVADMTTVQLDSPSKVKTMLRKANHNRATGATLLNERSSRSHSVFILRLSGHNETTGERTSGVLNLIDLAGSERLNASGATGDRLTETKAINKSLSCLGDVIHALAKNKEGAYIPYRNSKLTYLLQNSLGGNCKTLMFVNISPLSEHFGETLCSLRFATKVNSCRIGTARKAK